MHNVFQDDNLTLHTNPFRFFEKAESTSLETKIKDVFDMLSGSSPFTPGFDVGDMPHHKTGIRSQGQETLGVFDYLTLGIPLTISLLMRWRDPLLPDWALTGGMVPNNQNYTWLARVDRFICGLICNLIEYIPRLVFATVGTFIALLFIVPIHFVTKNMSQNQNDPSATLGL
ncbi:hypothetical protein N9Q05_00050 [bacterium]|nr:hypothetical protein [bacterium]